MPSVLKTQAHDLKCGINVPRRRGYTQQSNYESDTVINYDDTIKLIITWRRYTARLYHCCCSLIIVCRVFEKFVHKTTHVQCSMSCYGCTGWYAEQGTNQLYFSSCSLVFWFLEFSSSCTQRPYFVLFRFFNTAV